MSWQVSCSGKLLNGWHYNPKSGVVSGVHCNDRQVDWPVTMWGKHKHGGVITVFCHLHQSGLLQETDCLSGVRVGGWSRLTEMGKESLMWALCHWCWEHSLFLSYLCLITKNTPIPGLTGNKGTLLSSLMVEIDNGTDMLPSESCEMCQSRLSSQERTMDEWGQFREKGDLLGSSSGQARLASPCSHQLNFLPMSGKGSHMVFSNKRRTRFWMQWFYHKVSTPGYWFI